MTHKINRFNNTCMWLISNKTSVRESGLLDGFRDVHCHLLPAVDDGVRHADETMRILKAWASLGVSEVWLTPHVMEDIPNKPSELQGRFGQFTSLYAGTVTLHLAAEHMLDGLFAGRLAEDDVLPVGKEGDRLLVETSYYIPPINMEEMMERIRRQGYEPILAHPERYQYMDFADCRRWKDKGVLLQLNVPSLVGAYGAEVQAKARKLLDGGMYDYCGTDTHSQDQMECFLDSMIDKRTVRKVRRLSDAQQL